MRSLARRRPRARPPAVKAMVAMLLVSASSCLAGAVAPMTPQAPVRLNAALAVVALLLAAGSWCSRWPGWQHLGLGTMVAGLGLLTTQSASAAGTAALGMSFTWAAAYAAFFLRTGLAWTYAAAAGLAFGAGLLANPFPGAAHVWLLTALTGAVAVEVIGRAVGRLEQAATTDPLTGILNRGGLEREGRQALRDATRAGTPLSVVVVDLDGFKAVNDSDGHAAGDELLRAVADHWQARIRPSDVLARLGGDEFVLVLPDTDASEAEALMRRLRARSPVAYTYGSCVVPAGGGLEQALQQADRSLYTAKAARKQLTLPQQREAQAVAARS